MEQIFSWIKQVLGFSPEVTQNLITTLATVTVLWIVHRITLKTFIERISDAGVRYQWQKASGYVFFLLGVLVIGRIWFEGVQTVATFLGLLSAGLAIALKDPIANLFAWAFILWRRPFEVGDRIELDGSAGDVIDLRIFQFTLMEIRNWVDADQSTGRILHIPNGKVFTSTLANFTKGSDYIWNEIPILITFESDWEKAKQILQEIANQHAQSLQQNLEKSFAEASKRFLIKYDKLTPIVYTSVKNSGVLLTIRYLCDPRQRRTSNQEVWESVLRAFAQHADIDLAYPTQRFYLDDTSKRDFNGHLQTSQGNG
ncbi:MAG: mechanosensitive ion channel family protein [Anaerolineales bacterium]|nr:MAG: mechanosensitive ion channel family protein [Anaerolineales bacterium]